MNPPCGKVKPPLPARPSHLFPSRKNVLLPKPPENPMSDTMKEFLDRLSINSNDEKYELFEEPKPPATQDSSHSSNQSLSSQSSASVDLEYYGYMQPVCVPQINKINQINKEILLPDCSPPSPPKIKKEESSKFSDIFRRVMNKTNLNNSSIDYNQDVPSEVTSETSRQSCQQQQRPLPQPPTRDITSMPWYKNVDRKKGEELLRNGVDGYFLVRPSSKGRHHLTLTLWFHNRLYNIPVRRRADMQFALGTLKPNEQSFNSIEAMISNYQSEKLVLYSGGVKTGKTLLTSYPP